MADIIYSFNTESKQSFGFFCVFGCKLFYGLESRSMQFFVFVVSGVWWLMEFGYYVTADCEILAGCAVLNETQTNGEFFFDKYFVNFQRFIRWIQYLYKYKKLDSTRLYDVFLDLVIVCRRRLFAVVCVWIFFTSCVKQVLPKTQFRRRRQYHLAKRYRWRTDSSHKSVFIIRRLFGFFFWRDYFYVAHILLWSPSKIL